MTAVRKSSFCLVLLLVACLPAMLMSAADPDPLTDFTVPGLMGARKIIVKDLALRVFSMLDACREKMIITVGGGFELPAGTFTS